MLCTLNMSSDPKSRPPRREKKTKPETQKVGGTCGLHARNFPLPIRGFVDQDYADNLSEQDQVWLAAFNDKYYGADFRDTENGGTWSKDEQRAVNRDKNSARKDVFELANEYNMMDRLETPRNTGGGKVGNYNKTSVRATGTRFPNTGKILDPGSIPAVENTDLSPTPEYLNSSKYKERLAHFRSQLNPHKSNRAPIVTPELVRAETELKNVIPAAVPSEGQNDEADE